MKSFLEKLREVAEISLFLHDTCGNQKLDQDICAVAISSRCKQKIEEDNYDNEDNKIRNPIQQHIPRKKQRPDSGHLCPVHGTSSNSQENVKQQLYEQDKQPENQRITIFGKRLSFSHTSSDIRAFHNLKCVNSTHFTLKSAHFKLKCVTNTFKVSRCLGLPLNKVFWWTKDQKYIRA